MMNDRSFILVFGATDLQGGSVARALINKGWPVRVMVRNPSSPASLALRDAGAEMVAGNFDDIEAMKSAMTGAYGVFSVQPSSPGGTVTDDDEVRYGKTIASLASECGVQHLVYSSGSAVSDRPTGVAHFDTKAEIERHIHKLPIVSTIVRPATFMELFSAAAGRLIPYSRFSDDVLTADPFLKKLTALAGNGSDAFERALAISAKWEFNR
ncbi:hypothetical protein AWS46_14440 [Klebsiella aerogenes]|nr:hypothetical protein AWS46_14440 [Klebsiella aerogenes]KVI81132.1 hypothetical protein AWS47_14770 [Klebsiella aerogenes]